MAPRLHRSSKRIGCPSITMLKRKGDPLSPCLRPWLLFKYPKGEPLQITEKEGVEMHSFFPIDPFPIKAQAS